MEKVRPWCGQPSDRGRLRNRTEPPLADIIWAAFIVWRMREGIYQKRSVLCCVRQSCTMIRTHIWAVLKDECWFRFNFCVCLGLAFCVFLIQFGLFFSCVRFSFFSIMPRYWLGRTCPKTDILCWVRRKTWTQSINQYFTFRHHDLVFSITSYFYITQK